MFTLLPQAYANQGDFSENSEADMCKPKTDGRGVAPAFELIF